MLLFVAYKNNHNKRRMTITIKPIQYLKHIALAAVIIATASGCSVRIKNYVEMAGKLFESPEDISLSQQEIKDYPYAAQYIRVEGSPRAVMALAFDDNNVLKWRTGGDEVIHTKHGRFVGSVNMNGAISHTSDLDRDPLPCIQQNLQQPHLCPSEWQRTQWYSSATETHLHDTARTYSSEFRVIGQQQHTHADGTTLTVYEVEEVSDSFTNTFYLEQKTGRVVKSRQFLAPTIGYASIEEVKPYANDLQVVNQ